MLLHIVHRQVNKKHIAKESNQLHNHSTLTINYGSMSKFIMADHLAQRVVSNGWGVKASMKWEVFIRKGTNEHNRLGAAVV